MKILSGGQTGADRAALDFAIAMGIPHGGWCPRGRVAEDGRISAGYCLAETPNEDPAQRTAWNVRDADATVIFSLSESLSGGSTLTAEFARASGKPLLHLSANRDLERSAELLSAFLSRYKPRILNIAGPRESGEPGIRAFVRATLEKCRGYSWK